MTGWLRHLDNTDWDDWVAHLKTLPPTDVNKMFQACAAIDGLRRVLICVSESLKPIDTTTPPVPTVPVIFCGACGQKL